MRHARRGGQHGLEFGGSGEDSFVAVVVTKLTGALLFILLLTMVIMALIPRAVDAPGERSPGPNARSPLEIRTPNALPDAIVGRPYTVAFAASGGDGAPRWSLEGPVPEGLSLDRERGALQGTAVRGGTVELVVRASDSTGQASRTVRLVVYEPEGALSVPSRFAPKLPPIPLRAWLEQGFGFLVVALVHLVGMQTLSGLERRHDSRHDETAGRPRRFIWYRAAVRLTTLSALAALAAWLATRPGA